MAIYNKAISRAEEVWEDSKFTAKANISTKNEEGFAIYFAAGRLLLNNNISISNTFYDEKFDLPGYSCGIWLGDDADVIGNNVAKKITANYTMSSSEEITSAGLLSMSGLCLAGETFLYSLNITAKNDGPGEATAYGVLAAEGLHATACIMKDCTVSASTSGENAYAYAAGYSSVFGEGASLWFDGGFNGNVKVNAVSKNADATAEGFTGTNVSFEHSFAGKVTVSATANDMNLNAYSYGIDAYDQLLIEGFDGNLNISSKNTGSSWSYGLRAKEDILILGSQKGNIKVNAVSTESDANAYGIYSRESSVYLAGFECTVTTSASSKNSDSWSAGIWASEDLYFHGNLSKAISVSAQNVRATDTWSTTAEGLYAGSDLEIKDITAKIKVTATNEGDTFATAFMAGGHVSFNDLAGSTTVKATNKEHYGRGDTGAYLVDAEGEYFEVATVKGTHSVTATDGNAQAIAFDVTGQVYIDDMSGATVMVSATSKNNDASAAAILTAFGDINIDSDGLDFGKIIVTANSAKGKDAFAVGVSTSGVITKNDIDLGQKLSGNITVKSSGDAYGIIAKSIDLETAVNLAVTGGSYACGYYLGDTASTLEICGGKVSAALSDKTRKSNAFAVDVISDNAFDQIVDINDKSTVTGNIRLGSDQDIDMVSIESGSKLKGSLVDVEFVLLDIADSSTKNKSLWDIVETDNMTEANLFIDFDYGMTGDFLLCTKESSVDWDDAIAEDIFLMCDDSQTQLCTFKVDRITNKYLADTFYDFELKLDGNKMILSVSDKID